MPNLWELIKGKSSILFGTVYQHLTSPDPTITTIIVDAFYLESDIVQYDLEIGDQDFYVEVDTPSFDLEIDLPQYYLEIEDA